MTKADVEVRRLGQGDLRAMRELNVLFATVFDDDESYSAHPAGDDWLSDLLEQRHFIALVARHGDELVGGLVAYELQKFEQARREIYIYDLAVAEHCRRRGVATSLIEYLRHIAAERQAWVIFVQADYVDPPAIALYSKLGAREEVLHFDITPWRGEQHPEAGPAP